jgi:hypothetical protein
MISGVASSSSSQDLFSLLLSLCVLVHSFIASPPPQLAHCLVVIVVFIVVKNDVAMNISLLCFLLCYFTNCCAHLI